MGVSRAMAALLWFGGSALSAVGFVSVAPDAAIVGASGGAALAAPESGPLNPPQQSAGQKPKPGATTASQSKAKNEKGAATTPLFEPFGDLKRFGIEIVSPTVADDVVGRVNVRADVVADRPSAVAAVDFFIDGRLMFSDVEAPYELSWISGRPAKHVIEVRAYGPGRQMVSDALETRASRAASDLSGFSARVERVELHVRIEDDDAIGTPVDTAVLEVLENGVRQPIIDVEPVADLPLAVGLLIDHSGSMLEQLETALDAAASFVDGLLTHPNDKALVLGFADTPVVFQEFTNDSARLADSIALIDSGRYTALYDSIVAVSRRFVGIDGRRAAILLTDGGDQGSDHDLREAIAAAQRADLALYPVAVELSPRFAYQGWVLRQLARETGGRVFSLGRRGDPEEIYRAIEEDLRSQYRISYAPLLPGGGGEWRELEVRLRVSDDDVRKVVRTRRGYFAQ